jgi:leukotriene-A4 hydrolase
MKREDPHSYTDFGQSRISHIDLHLSPDFSTKRIQINATYKLDPPSSGSLYLDTRDLQIDRIHSDRRELNWEVDFRDDILGDRLHIKDLDQISELCIELSTSSKASALQWLSPQQTMGGVHPFLYSQCFALHARSLFPCQDTPLVRFTYDACIEVPQPLTAVMAAAGEGDEHREGTSLFRFHMPQPIPSYLFAFAVGNIAFKEMSERCGIYAEPEMLDDAAWEFEENEKRLGQIENLFGPYIWDRYDILVMPPSFPYGAMENPRLTFLSPVYVVGDRSGTWVVTHEMAHAWTGNLVTNATWEDFWLNEGWTTYAENRSTEVLEGRDYSQLLAVLGRNAMLDEMKRLGEDSERTCLKYSQKGVDPDAVVSNIPYEKGSAFLVQLENAVGRDTFDVFIQKYISEHAFQSLTTEEFVDYLQKQLPQALNEIDVEKWLYQPGFPESAEALDSEMYEEVEAFVTEYKNGHLPEKEQVSNWIFHQVFLFIQMLPKKIPADDCRKIEDLFDFKGSPRYAFLYEFYSLCIRSGYREMMPDIEHFLKTIGVSSRIVKVYRALAETDWSKGLSRQNFDRYKESYHPIARANIERALSEAGI